MPLEHTRPYSGETINLQEDRERLRRLAKLSRTSYFDLENPREGQPIHAVKLLIPTSIVGFRSLIKHGELPNIDEGYAVKYYLTDHKTDLRLASPRLNTVACFEQFAAHFGFDLLDPEEMRLAVKLFNHCAGRRNREATDIAQALLELQVDFPHLLSPHFLGVECGNQQELTIEEDADVLYQLKSFHYGDIMQSSQAHGALVAVANQNYDPNSAPPFDPDRLYPRDTRRFQPITLNNIVAIDAFGQEEQQYLQLLQEHFLV